MLIDWTHFTPWAALAGGILLGLASALFVLLNGRILGISGIVGGLLRPRAGDMGWRLAFVLGMLVAPGLYWLVVCPTQPRRYASCISAAAAEARRERSSFTALGIWRMDAAGVPGRTE